MIIWISSYPKSGNTWVRAFLSAYLDESNDEFKLSLINKIGEFPDHNILSKYMESKNFHNLGEISKHWIRVQEFINLQKKITFLKTHSALCNINGNVFTNSNNTLLIIYIVRDPRNVVLSMSNHFGESQDKCFKTIINERYIVYPSIGKQLIPCTLVGNWSNHYLSWKNMKSIKKIIIRYEDLINNSKNTFEKIINFLSENSEIKKDEKKLSRSIDSTKFENLKKLEDEHGFSMGQKNKFFHLGKDNDWKNLLDIKIEDKIKSIFNSEMKDLDYI
tara:strand:+ start:5595 stop:6419 length:825 start_codon:yes stop_codon:yes gene_type:complete